MPAAVNVDDATKPLDNDAANYPVSVGAEEFRKLKDKVNRLFLMTGIDAVSGTDPTEKLITTNGVGLLTNISHNPVNAATILYGFATAVVRTGKDNHTVAVMATAINGAGNTLTGDRGTFGVVTQAINSSTALGNLVGAEFAIANTNPNKGAQIFLGVDIVFKNRGDGELTPAAGLGANKYNLNTTAIQISSQARGTAGEFCGWNNGIVFTEYSMDLAITGGQQRGYAIDFYPLHYDGVPNVDTAFRVDAVIRMRTLQSILWYDGVDKIKMTVNPVTGRWTIFNNGVEVFGINVGTGLPYVMGVPMNNP